MHRRWISGLTGKFLYLLSSIRICIYIHISIEKILYPPFFECKRICKYRIFPYLTSSIPLIQEFLRWDVRISRAITTKADARIHTHTHTLACTRNLINRDNPSKSASSIRSCSCARTYKYMYIHTHAYVFFPFDKYAGRYDLDKNTIPVARDIHRCRQ